MTNLIIMDASGSMSDRVEDVKGGLKQMLADIRKLSKNPSLFKNKEEENKQTTIIVDFSDNFRVLVNSNSVEDLKDELADNYSVRGSTALYDAIGKAFSMVGKEEDKVFVNIITDGDENSSVEWNGVKIKALIEANKAKGWAILFIGADEKCLDKAVSLGITRGNTMSFMADAKFGNKSLKAKMGKKGYDGTLNVARAMYMSNTSNDVASLENLMTEADTLREATDLQRGIKEEDI